MRFILMVLVLAGGCVESTSGATADLSMTCDSSTRYLQHEVDCLTGDADHPDGVCVDVGQGAGPECLYKVAVFANRAQCPGTETAYSIATDVSHVSFCHTQISGPRDPVEW